MSYQETWEIVPDGDQMIVRFSVAESFIGDNTLDKATGPKVTAIKELYETYGMPMLAGLSVYLQTSTLAKEN